ncbi:acyl-CoA dehydrogenase family protein [Streptomyces sp. NPDC006529]|uniref:acyl-CoA dehydrogenase family protein n=1 Tax=Streptomyces sp. NPDC006529 TaxID=3157177 RepID=UPI0033BDB604
MRFLPTDEQSDFARTLRALLGASDVPAVVRSWSGGAYGPGRALWTRLADTGLFALAAPQDAGARKYEGLGVHPVELALGFVELGRAAVPGPLAETVAAVALLSDQGLGDGALAERFLPGLLSGEAVATLTLAGGGPYALDAAAADHVFTVSAAGALRLAGAGAGPPMTSLDPARRLSRPGPDGELLAAGPGVAAAAGAALRWARLLTAAQSLGVGEALLGRTVEYVKQRTQFGVAIGSFQAVKHRLADTLIALEFARPLVWAAALTLAPRDIAAAKVAAGEAAYRAALTALQLHGAVGYTEELDLSLWLRKARPLRDAWGTPSTCRAELLPAP